MKFYVVSLHWDSVRQVQNKYIAGEFGDYFNALLFRDAYNAHFHANAEIIEGSMLVNR